MLPGDRCRMAVEVRSLFLKDKKPVIYAKAGDIVEVIRDEAHNCMVTVNNNGIRFGVKRNKLIPIPSKPPF